MAFSALSMLASASHEDITRKRPNGTAETQPKKRAPRTSRQSSKKMEQMSAYSAPSISMNNAANKGRDKIMMGRTVAFDNYILRRCFNEFADKCVL
jgi:hypothetical protein